MLNFSFQYIFIYEQSVTELTGVLLIDTMCLFCSIRDIFALYSNPEALPLLNVVLAGYAELMKDEIDVVVGIEARGFLLGPTLANLLNCTFVPARKKGKLPGSTRQKTYALEYGTVLKKI